MSLGCVTRGGDSPPTEIIDTGTLSITLDNQGVATLQVSILTKDLDPITKACFIFPLNDVIFKGFLDSDSPRVLEGSEYIEHVVTAVGSVCENI